MLRSCVMSELITEMETGTSRRFSSRRLTRLPSATYCYRMLCAAGRQLAIDHFHTLRPHNTLNARHPSSEDHRRCFFLMLGPHSRTLCYRARAWTIVGCRARMMVD